MQAFNVVESEVRYYCRRWPTVFVKARGSILTDERGREFIDFFAGAGALNYGHNHPMLRDALIEYMLRDGVTHALDMATAAKRSFLDTLTRTVLAARRHEYKVQFAGPAGVNAVEAALKLARKATGRSQVLGFDGAFHGMTVGALQVSDQRHSRLIGTPHPGSLPFDNQTVVPDPDVLEKNVRGLGHVPDRIAAVIVEMIQGEGGVRPARHDWLAALTTFCRRHGILIIVDDIQAGCGRTGPFLSFECLPIDPDMVCLSKSIGGYGLPLSLVLLRPSLDLWFPGEHNGTFRGDNLAFVAGAAALKLFWTDRNLQEMTQARATLVGDRMTSLKQRYPEIVTAVTGRGLFWGLHTRGRCPASEISRAAFERGLLVETCGLDGQVLKIIPSLTITDDQLEQGLSIIESCVALHARIGENTDDRTLA